MPDQRSDLVDRFHRALGSRRDGRNEVLGEIAAMACALGIVEVRRDPVGMVVKYHDRAFEIAGEGGDLRVDWGTATSGHLVEDEDGTWMLEVEGRREPLFDDGLVRLLVEGLGLPSPVAERVRDHDAHP